MGGNIIAVAVKSDTADKSVPKKHSSSCNCSKSMLADTASMWSLGIQTFSDWQNLLKFFVRTPTNFEGLLIALVMGVVLCVCGYFIFRKLEKRFAEEL